MCGIVGFLSAGRIDQRPDPGPYARVVAELREGAATGDWERAAAALSLLAAHFGHLMSFPVFREIVTDPASHELFEALAATLDDALERVTAQIREGGSSDRLGELTEPLRDYLWQIRTEVLGFVERVTGLLPDPADRTNVPRLFTAWAIERVLDSLDKLEVRGRDSAGIAIGLPLHPGWSPAGGMAAELARRAALPESATGHALLGRAGDGRPVVRVLHKVANLVGRLGDNGTTLREAIRGDRLLWEAAAALNGISILAHTRWASNGIISVANCHPVNGQVLGREGGGEVLAVINGDIDNYAQLMATGVRGRGLACDAAVTTDAKILPVKLALESEAAHPLEGQVMAVMRGCRGSLAAGVQLLGQPHRLAIAQQGSGQALYLGSMADGWFFASEVYGLAATCRSYRGLNTGGEIGVVMGLSVAGGEASFTASRLTGEPWEPASEAISIFSRDIYRGSYDYFIEKEIAEAPESVRKTLTGKYVATPQGVRFHVSGFGNGAQLMHRLRGGDRKPVRRIVVIGHGTASIAGLGIVHLLRRALARADLAVDWCKASELFGFAANERLDDAILVAVSQSGTTTDTNRIVDIARRRGAWVHAIVNRRNSALVQKSDSYLYTSDGRDVEMSVASTKAYYSQVAAGKVLSLFLASVLGSLSGAELAAEVVELESLPEKIRQVLEQQPAIAQLAQRYALKARNWALVGNGVNRVAAEEIRIKLSELCYKAIPCDVTEDKKHIDLSTEPFTLVVANDLPEEVVQDTAKEVAIFKAHNGSPLVLCSAGESRFDSVAEAVIRLPEMGGGLAFVLATVAGHLFGVAAARAIDASAQLVRRARGLLALGMENPEQWDREGVLAALHQVADTIGQGTMDTALPASLASLFMRRLVALEREGENGEEEEGAAREAMLATLTALVQELSRSIDTIRHQAKTVTVGISRPQQELSPLVKDLLWRLNLSENQIKDADRETLEALSPLIDLVNGGLRYRVAPVAGSDEWELRVEAEMGVCTAAASRYQQGAPPTGSKRAVLRTGTLRFSTGHRGDQSLVILPIWREGATHPTDLLLIDLGLLPKAPVTQMISVLKGIGKYDEWLEACEERAHACSLATLLEGLSPREIIFSQPGRAPIPERSAAE